MNPQWTFWRVSQIALTMGVLGVLLTGAVFLAIVIIAFGGVPSYYIPGFSGLLVSLFFAWLLGRGVTKCKRRANDLATAEYGEAIRLDPPVSLAHCNRGFVCAQRREYAKAVAHYDAAIQLDPTLPDAYVGRVNAYLALGQYERVVAEYTEAIRLDPNHALAYCARATAHNGLGRFDRSIPDATEAIRLAPHLYLGYDARGYGLLQRGGFHWILKLVAIAWMLVTFGFLRRDHFDWRTPTGSKADFEHASADFTEALRLNPTAWDCYLGRAQVYRALGEHVQAAADEARVREALNRHPSMRRHRS